MTPRARLAVAMIVILLAFWSNAIAQDKPTRRQKELIKLIEAFERAMDEYTSAKRSGKRSSTKFWTKEYPARFLQFAKQTHDDDSLEACRYLIKKFYISSERYAAISLVTEHHLDKRKIGDFLGSLVFKYDDDEAVDECLLSAMKSSNVNARAHATYQYARLLISRRNWCLDGEAERYEGIFDKKQLATVVSEARRKKIIDLLNRVTAESRRIDYLGRPLIDWAKGDLYEIQHLEIGQTAPNVKGRDSKGINFRLSDYRGKVVVIVFWAHWCRACMADLPKETTFVAKMKGRPMAWIGVNGDENVKLLQKAEKKGTVNFRSWHDGQDGAIAKKLNVLGWPAMYVVDDQGVIRYKSRVAVDFDKAVPIIQSLVRKVEHRSKKQ